MDQGPVYLDMPLYTCPHCDIIPVSSEEPSGFRVVCPSCHMFGEERSTLMAAAEDWNEKICEEYTIDFTYVTINVNGVWQFGEPGDGKKAMVSTLRMVLDMMPPKRFLDDTKIIVQTHTSEGWCTLTREEARRAKNTPRGMNGCTTIYIKPTSGQPREVAEFILPVTYVREGEE